MAEDAVCPNCGALCDPESKHYDPMVADPRPLLADLQAAEGKLERVREWAEAAANSEQGTHPQGTFGWGTQAGWKSAGEYVLSLITSEGGDCG